MRYFKQNLGGKPFNEWLESLEINARFRVMAHIERVALGGSKKHIRFLGDGVWEIKIHYGPGYRVYFGNLKGQIILLLAGGDKGSQKRDISLAKKYWRSIHV